ncbi:undecaprenyl-diphosphatase [Clostridium akagii]|uniref:undecaprenyl-diphosphatase n=1 Tax=Clostridium akagii TaxID=91623 RepID=UPI000479B861|nr:undecaprenyl-diphosphatase [Clostridium akagii]
MNLELFRLINNLANKNKILDDIMIFFTNYVPYMFMLILVVLFIGGIVKKNSKYQKAAINVFIVTVINLALNFLIGNIFYVNRPFVNNKVNLLLPHVQDASFPSDHATGTMSIALGLGKYNRLIGTILTMLSFVVGFSRIYVGHHYPLDVVGAYIIVFITSNLYSYKIRGIVDKLYDRIVNKAYFFKLKIKR